MQNNKQKYTFAVGRRKSSVARVRLYKGVGDSLINNKKVEGSFFERLFVITNTLGKFYFTAFVKGGGRIGQIQAVMHGLARTLDKYDSEKYRSLLKKEGLLKRDSRERQRRMVGTGGKSRRKKQSPKR